MHGTGIVWRGTGSGSCPPPQVGRGTHAGPQSTRSCLTCCEFSQLGLKGTAMLLWQHGALWGRPWLMSLDDYSLEVGFSWKTWRLPQ